jgi:uncharacterized paraquat-inducible protein A
MPLVYKCDKCREYTGEQIIVCPRCASKINEVQPASAQQLKAEIAALVNLFPATIPVDGCHTALVGLVYKLRQLSAV